MITPNAYFIAALAGLLVVEVMETAAELLNLGSLNTTVPAEFSDTYDADTYARSQRYTRVKTSFGFWAAGFDLAVLLAFWLAGGFGWLDEVLRGLEIGPIPTGLLFFVVLGVAKGILDLPFNAYATFVIEEHFGFNRTSRLTFILDLLKGALVSAVIGLPLLAAFLAIFEYLGWYGWLVAWAAGAVASLVMQVILPTFILPLFNKFTPLQEGELRSAIFSYAERADFPLKAVYVIDASRRSTKGNAYFTGFGKSKRIALFDTLVSRHPLPELVAVLAHEIGHYKKKHVLVGTMVGIVEMGLFLGLFSVFLHQDGLFAAFGVSRPSVYIGVVAVAILLRLLQFVLSFGAGALSRHNERQADAFAAATTDGGSRLADGLARLSKDSLSNLTPHPFYVALNYSHPPVLERVRVLRRGSPPAGSVATGG
ncbi:MAG TPA: M48 family metallopeptidase [Thermoleophilia bacterium]|nr:M48 family metallopeptidase [Thermoleophilia bacterium]